MPGSGLAVAPYSIRNNGVLHRNGVTAADKLGTVGTITLTGETTAGGALAFGTTYYVTVAAYNRWGNALPGVIQSLAPGGSNNALKVAFAQVAGADGYYIFLSTSATGPLWVARITEAQRAAGCEVTAVGTVGAGGAPGSAYVDVVGTGLASNVNPYLFNNAYTPATPTPINCIGYSRAHCHVKLAVTDLRSLPSLVIVPFLVDQLSPTDLFQGQLMAVNLLSANGESLEQDFEIDIDGSTGFVVVIDTITGQGAAVSIWVELA